MTNKEFKADKVLWTLASLVRDEMRSRTEKESYAATVSIGRGMITGVAKQLGCELSAAVNILIECNLIKPVLFGNGAVHTPISPTIFLIVSLMEIIIEEEGL